MSLYRRYSLPLLILTLLFLFMLMAVYPQSSLNAGLRGLAIWWDVLFPSLFPFFVISELLLGFGIVHFIGALLDPLMQPLFRVPGCGGFVAAVSCASGYPIGAKLTAKLWEQKWITRIEGERLVAFTTSSDPIFLIGAVSVGFFHQPEIALVLGAAHYGGVLIIGLLMRFHGSRSGETDTRSDRPQPTQKAWSKSTNTKAAGRNRQPGPLRQALYAMHTARLEDGRPLGELLRQAITSSLRLIIVVGGLVVFFCVILEALTNSGLMSGLHLLTASLLTACGLPPTLTESIVGGIFEVTLGAQAAGEATAAALPFKVAAAAFVLSWGGLSVHAQVASILNMTNLRYMPFLLARAAHGIISALLALVLWRPLMGQGSSPVFSPIYDIAWSPGFSSAMLLQSLLVLAFILAGMLSLSWLSVGTSRLYVRLRRTHRQ
ncbi:sporulation integral membrane protein YlbJ [Paenibacillus sp. SEL1]|uniref:sporulation integral membrane protein YlbJ n=1 Tax=Paenibacillus TaxID=44249 RepID=UPI0008460DFA|nr:MULTISPECIES: sporulation integral membrane protein YlbJ [Paenibacillus]AOK89745.1 sporulation integral membrane protein YlbJ [Paenibacillus polymyxa]KAF6577277.1 sporulation integral membrane protein YlbJ [Paenibacillus sp. EKM212P]MDY8046906.1 sporulation integral membrane protein YlbJ [Paenibacillus polymyxa]URJ38759.1 sporulation integral membrane protein YlbJ [Paenibacillus polymyxa]